MNSEDEQIDSCNNDIAAYQAYKKTLNEGEQKVSEGLDRAILAISSAALGFAFVLSNDFQSINKAENLIYLKLSWVAFGLSIMLVVLSLVISGYLYKRNREVSEKLINNRESIIQSIEKKNTQHPDFFRFSESSVGNLIGYSAHFGSAFMLIVGIVLFSLFFDSNVNQAIKPTTTTFIETNIKEKKNDNRKETSTTATTISE